MRASRERIVWYAMNIRLPAERWKPVLSYESDDPILVM
jgi:hypothetical protein